MSPQSKRDMVPLVGPRYQTARREEKSRILDEFCATTGYHRKYAIHLLNSAPEEVSQFKGRRRGYTYSAEAVRVLAAMWEAADYPWSVRLKAMIPLWLPWARNHIKGLTPELDYELLEMSPRTVTAISKCPSSSVTAYATLAAPKTPPEAAAPSATESVPLTVPRFLHNMCNMCYMCRCCSIWLNV